MIIKFILFIFIFILVGCGNSQEPPKSSVAPSSTAIYTIQLRNITLTSQEDKNLSFNKNSFEKAYTYKNPLSGIKITSLPLYGRLELNNTTILQNTDISLNDIDNIIYIPNANFYGNDYFTYKAYSGLIYSAESNITLSISSENDTPVFGVFNFKKSFEPNEINTTLDQPTSIITIDLNHDGRDDILTVSKNDNKIIWLEQDLNGTFTQHDISTSLTKARDIKAVDIDKDGDIDIVAGGDEKLSIYINTNNTFNEQIVDNNSSYAVDIKDIDQDGNLEIVSADYLNNSIFLYKKTNQIWIKNIVDSSIKNPTDTVIYDYDHDGKEDIISTAFNDGLVWYKQGTNSFTKNIIYTFSDNQGANKLTINHDKIYSVTYNSGKILENNTSIIKTNQPTSIKIADIDSDGDDDIITTSYSYSYMTWFENIDNIYKPHYIDSYCLASDLSLDDIDGDGDLDIVTSIQDKSKIILFNSSDSIYIKENNTFVTDINASDVDGDKLYFTLSGEDSSLFDINNSGTIIFKIPPDFENPQDSNKNNMYNITVNVSDGNISIKKSFRVVVENLTYFTKSIISTGYKNISDLILKDNFIYVADYDDKLFRLDITNNFSKNTINTSYDYPLSLTLLDNTLVVSFYDGVIYRYDDSLHETLVDDDCFSPYKIITSDIDNDTKNDIVATCEDKIKWYRQESNNSLTIKDISIPFNNYPYSLSTSSDSHHDIYVAVPDDNSIYKLKNDGNESFTKEILDNDIYAVNTLLTDQNITFASSSNDNTIVNYIKGSKKIINNPETIAYPNSLNINDIDGDGQKDIVVTSKDDGKILWLKNLGNNRYEEHLIATVTEPTTAKVYDINNDGIKDILVSTKVSIYIFYGSQIENKEQTTQ